LYPERDQKTNKEVDEPARAAECPHAACFISFYRPHTVQVISAGKDGIFGPGGEWSPETAAKDAGPRGQDDLSNFHVDLLGR
jgi:hypothetical protein